MSSVLFMLFKQPIVLASITFLTGCYEVIKGSFTALRYGNDMVSFQDNILFYSSPAVLASKIIPSENSKPNPQSSLLQMVVVFLALTRAKCMPFKSSNKWFATLQAIATFPKRWISQTPSNIFGFIATFPGAIQAPTASCEFSTTYRTFNWSIFMPFTIHNKYIIAQYTGGVK